MMIKPSSTFLRFLRLPIRSGVRSPQLWVSKNFQRGISEISLWSSMTQNYCLTVSTKTMFVLWSLILCPWCLLLGSLWARNNFYLTLGLMLSLDKIYDCQTNEQIWSDAQNAQDAQKERQICAP